MPAAGGGGAYCDFPRRQFRAESLRQTGSVNSSTSILGAKSATATAAVSVRRRLLCHHLDSGREFLATMRPFIEILHGKTSYNNKGGAAGRVAMDFRPIGPGFSAQGRILS